MSNKTVLQPAKEIPVAKEADVIVVGGGLAGVAAAVAAARGGAKVILIEKSILLGGLATSGHVCIYLPLDDGAGNKVYGGLTEELLFTCIKYGYDNLADCWRDKPARVEHPSGRYRTNFNIPAAVLALDELVQNEGIDVVFDTVMSEPIMEGKAVKGIIVENKSGRTAYLAKQFIDATGDSDLLYRAGADCETTTTIVSHWAHELEFETMKKGIEEGDMLRVTPLRWIGQSPSDVEDGKLPSFPGTTAEGINDYVKLSRKLTLDFLKRNQRPDYCMITLPTMPQVRMTRRLIGDKEFVVDCYHSEETSVGCAIFSIDNPAEVYEFPYEGLITKKLDNVSAAGRMVSATGRGWEIMRFIPACVMTGEAAGTAAAIAVKHNCNLHEIDVKELQAKLLENGNIIHRTPEMEGTKAEKKSVMPPRKPDGTIRRDMHN